MGKWCLVIQENNLQGYDNELDIDISDWSPGIYMVVLTDSGVQQTVKLMVTPSSDK
jgi:hypothetical protein